MISASVRRSPRPHRGKTLALALAFAVALGSIAAAGVGPSGVVGVMPADAETLPAGFQDTVAIAGLTNPTVVRFASDGRVFVAEKSGIIKVYDDLDDRTPTVVADLRTQVHNYWDRGLLGFNLDPQFPASPFVYVLYARDALVGEAAPRWGAAGASSDPCPTPPGPLADGCVISGRLSRLQLSGDTMVGNERVLVDDWCQQYPSHSVGDIEFGPDGSLYASGGDGASFTFDDYGQFGSPRNPCGDPPTAPGTALAPPTSEGGSLRSQDARTTGDPLGLDGTVIRVDRSSGAGVAGNPWEASQDANGRRVVAYGLRNPFRMAVKPGTGEVWVADVGGGGSEEVDRIADPGGSAENFGWPCYEGDGPMPGFAGTGFSLCQSLYAAAGAVTAPAFSYRHDALVVPGESCPSGSSSISGIAFYQGGAYPDDYDGAMILADYSRNCLWAVPPGGDPVTLVDGAHGPVDVQIGPGGDVFYVDLAGGTIRRITWSEEAPPSGSSYLSDLPWTSMANGWGPAERNTSNGEDQALDGRPITLDGVVFDHGLGAHATSEIVFHLGGNCTGLTAQVGVDDEVGAGGSVVFSVVGDGRELFRSATLTGSSATASAVADLAGVQELRLRVTDGGDGQTADHADWADPFVVCGPTGPVALSDRPWQTAVNGWGPVELDSSNGEDQARDGGPITLNGARYDKGLGVHAASRVTYALAASCTRFQADIGVDDEAGPDGSVVFRVLGDGALLYESTTMRGRSPTRHLDLDVGGVDLLELAVDDGGDGPTLDHGDWANAAVTCGSPAGPARAHIDTPSAATHWRVGDPIGFSGGAEDGTGVPVSASQLTWTLVMQHCPSNCHAHVIQSFQGVRSGSFVAPDHEYPSHLELRLAATLPSGDSVERRMDLDPRPVDLSFDTTPAGLPLTVGGGAADAPFTRSVIVGSVNSLSAPASAALPGGDTATFTGWSDGGARSHTVVAPATATTYRATYAVTAPTAPSGVSGTVSEAGSGVAVGGAWVAVLRSSDFSLAGGGVANGSGDYSVVVPAGSYFVYVVDPAGGHAAGFFGAPTAVTVAAGSMVDVDPAVVSTRGSVTGTVTDSVSGVPIGGAWAVTLNAATASPGVGAVADGAGRFAVGGLRAGNRFVGWFDPTGAHAPRFFPQASNVPDATAVAVAAGASTVADGALAPQAAVGGGATLSGAVVEAGTNTPLAGVFVMALRASDYRMARGAVTDAAGRYSLDVAAGGYKLAFIDSTGRHDMEWHDNQPYHGLATAATVTAPAVVGAALDANTGTMAGAIVDDPAATGVPGAWAIAIAPTGIAGGAVTDTNGAYTLPELAPGTYRATFLDPNGGRTQEYWDNSPTYTGATTLNITPADTTTANAALHHP